MDFPPLARVRQQIPQPTIADIPAAVRDALRGSRVWSQLTPAARVAVAVGSRGIANLATIVRTCVDELRDMNFRPFVLAAMGSHGGATPDGQQQLLADYGVTESAMGVPVKTEMDVVELGTNSFGLPVYWDRNALSADAVVTVSRVKAHTDFQGRYESGVLKMLVIGLGKREGATQVHKLGVRGLRDVLPESGKVILAKAPPILGLAILENAAEKTAHIQALERDQILSAEPALLEHAKRLMA